MIYDKTQAAVRNKMILDKAQKDKWNDNSFYTNSKDVARRVGAKPADGVVKGYIGQNTNE